MIHSDVAVVGAGPAGSAAAFTLASAGVPVVLLERSTFPRDKACGDGVSARGLEALARMGLGEWSSRFPAPQVLRLSAPDGQVLDVRPEMGAGTCYGRTIPRYALDARLAQAAQEAGARLVEGVHVREIERTGDGPVHLRAADLEVSAQLLILADGSHAPLTRSLGLANGLPELVAIRRYLEGDAGPAERIEIHFRADILPGYTWVFPAGEGRVNVGTGSFVRSVRQGQVALRQELERFAEGRLDIAGRLASARPAGPTSGHPLRTDLARTRTHAARMLVAGDAAGLVNPLSGEGIAPALESGELAARTALAALQRGDLSARALYGYSRALRQRYAADGRAARLLRRALNSRPLLNRVFRRLRADEELALQVGYVVIGHHSPRRLLRPETLLRLLL